MIRTKAAAYGLLAVYEIAKRHRGVQNPPGVQAGDVARKYKLPTAYAAKIMSQLARKGVLRSDRGPSGGFYLNRAPDKITLWDVLDGVESFGPDSKRFAGYPAPVQNMLNRTVTDGMGRLREVCKKVTVTEML